MKQIQTGILVVKRSLPLAVASELLFSILVSFVFFGHASAGQMTARSIQMSDSTPSGGSISSGVGSGTNVAYKVSFTPTATTAIGGIVIDFCSNSAQVGDSCTLPTSFSVNRATTAVQAGQSAGCGTGAFSTYTSDATAYRIIITRGSPAATSGVCTVDIGNGTSNGFTNPSTNATFYARIYTYGSAALAQGHNSASPTGFVDYGAVALSTANVITITARVQEALTFCVSAAAPTSNCGGTSTPTITLGHGSSQKALDSTAVDAAWVYAQTSTNAGSGAVVRMHHAYACGGLSLNGGTTCGIPATGAGAGSAGAITAGTAAFGLYVAPGAAISGGSGSTTSDSNYYNASHTTIGASNPDLYFGMDTTSANNVTTTYGEQIFSCAGPISNVNTQLVFGATASNVTTAGLYSANISLIASATF